jgi:alpha-galactosidase/6-phospho-beta-glucosidase family protein
MPVNVTMIGGGSSSFVPPLIRSFIRSEVLGDATVTLMDVDEGRVKVMEDLARKLIDSEGSRLQVRSTLDQRESLVDADFVIVAISVGGMGAWANDIEIPARYGVVMHVADSVGPGGIMRALRNAPVLASIAEDVAQVAPDAWVFNYTNPAPVETLALRTVPQVKSLGLCSCTAHPASAAWLAEQCGVEPDEIAMPPVVAGLNHCASVVDLRLRDGSDALPLARERATNPVVKWVLDTYGVLPYCWSHWVEFYPQMQWLEEPLNGTAQGVRMRYGITTHDMANERARVQQWTDLAQQWTAPGAGPVALSDLPPGSEDEGIEVIEIMESILDHRNEIHVVNAVNGGAIPNLPPEAIVEVTANVSAYGVRPIHAGPLPEPLAAHLRGYYALQQQMVKAALSGEREDALHAFLLEPTLQARLDLEQTHALLDEMLEANAEFLPRFAGAPTP